MASPALAPIPAELLTSIVSIAAWEAAEVNKPWLANIACTSRLIFHAVKPIPYHTVTLTARNHDAISACAFYGNFSLTCRLWVGKAPAALALVAAAFAQVEHVACTAALYTTLRSVDALFCPRMLTLRGRMPRDDPQLVRFVKDIKHLHLHLADEPHALLAARPADMALRFVVLECKASGGWLVGSVIPFFLSCPALERVLVCVTPDAGAELAAYAAAHGSATSGFSMTRPRRTDGSSAPARHSIRSSGRAGGGSETGPKGRVFRVQDSPDVTSGLVQIKLQAARIAAAQLRYSPAANHPTRSLLSRSVSYQPLCYQYYQTGKRNFLCLQAKRCPKLEHII